ncbi:hypothetical protein MMAN_53170 [Mycobacterium mantenii]|uniref:TetR family transcriptional regulator n=1 Tax=Mycobacterium mantenii TaxID=560555 RepID=A0A1X0FP20_MYCNT|nr:hypothetical protein [Mycobacterium mantenii]MCV7242944.1 hypothetical protein [Mycobacterium mantenii]ORB03471.1 hypothetical protein BST30_18480 [Mycobacterium mantenii]BBY41183.1 hypothetical protein MMAN_53170 [Mycobacterium mantenii]
MVEFRYRASVRKFKSETAKRTARKQRRVRELRADAVKDKRRYKTRLAYFRAFLELARDPSTESITVAKLCERCEIQEAAFHKRFPKDPDGLRPLQRFTLVAVEELTHATLREVRLMMEKREGDSDEPTGRLDRLTMTIAVLVHYMTRYQRLFNVEGIVPREVILTLSDVLAQAIIWTDPLSRQQKADFTRMAKYHAAALVGIIRSGLGEEVDRAEYVGSLTHAMVAQMLPPLLIQYGDADLDRGLEMAERIEPATLKIMDSHAARRLAALIGRELAR